MRSVERVFDFVSPFAYLQLERFERLPAGLEVRLRPVVLGALLDHWGTKGPAEIPQKRRFTYRYVQWLAERNGIPFRMPPAHPFNPIRPLRLCLALGCEAGAVRTIFRYLWRDGGEVASEEGWTGLCRRLQVRDADARIQDPAVKEELRRNTEDACRLGVFGVPTFVIDGELFWGFDATELVLDFLRDPGLFGRGELARVSELPLGVQRREKREPRNPAVLG
jgi:2-hydroxychromene-2-carboxylate isomerase